MPGMATTTTQRTTLTQTTRRPGPRPRASPYGSPRCSTASFRWSRSWARSRARSLLFGLDALDGPIQVALVVCAMVAALVIMKNGHPWAA